MRFTMSAHVITKRHWRALEVSIKRVSMSIKNVRKIAAESEQRHVRLRCFWGGWEKVAWNPVDSTNASGRTGFRRLESSGFQAAQVTWYMLE